MAIHTNYIGPTTHRGARVKATCDLGEAVTVYWDYNLTIEQNHDKAFRELASNLGWSGRWYRGSSGGGFHYCRASEDTLVEHYENL